MCGRVAPAGEPGRFLCFGPRASGGSRMPLPVGCDAEVDFSSMGEEGTELAGAPSRSLLPVGRAVSLDFASKGELATGSFTLEALSDDAVDVAPLEESAAAGCTGVASFTFEENPEEDAAGTTLPELLAAFGWLCSRRISPPTALVTRMAASASSADFPLFGGVKAGLEAGAAIFAASSFGPETTVATC